MRYSSAESARYQAWLHKLALSLGARRHPPCSSAIENPSILETSSLRQSTKDENDSANSTTALVEVSRSNQLQCAGVAGRSAAELSITRKRGDEDVPLFRRSSGQRTGLNFRATPYIKAYRRLRTIVLHQYRYCLSTASNSAEAYVLWLIMEIEGSCRNRSRMRLGIIQG